jgi:hypothetical protein
LPIGKAENLKDKCSGLKYLHLIRNELHSPQALIAT